MTRQWVGVLGMAIAVAGIGTGWRAMVWGGMGVLALAVLWRIWASRKARQDTEARNESGTERSN